MLAWRLSGGGIMRMAGGRRGGAALVLVLALVLATAVLWDRPGDPAETAGPTLPDRFAGYSYLTADVSTSPPGPALALYQQGYGVEFMDFPQALVLGGSGTSYRRVDLAEDRGGRSSQSDPASMLLSPDGNSVAVGIYLSDSASVAIVDLSTGEHSRHPVENAVTTVPMAWSPDGGLLAYVASGPYTQDGVPSSTALVLLDVADGTSRTVPVEGAVGAAAFAPSGEEIVVQTGGPGEHLLVLRLDGEVRRELALPQYNGLAGPAAWSADGRLIATTQTRGACTRYPPPGVSGYIVECGPKQVAFLDATGTGQAVPPPLDREAVAADQVLGWTAAGDLLVAGDDRNVPLESGPNDYLIRQVRLDDGTASVLSVMPTAGNFAVSNLQLATALLPDLRTGPTGPIDRGPWPGWALGGAAVLLAALTAAATALVRNRMTGRLPAPSGRRTASAAVDLDPAGQVR